MKLLKSALLLLLTPFAIALADTDDPLEGISFAYPFEYREEEDAQEKANNRKAKEESPTAQSVQVGNVKVTVDGKVPDFRSECKAEWEKMQDKNKSSRTEK